MTKGLFVRPSICGAVLLRLALLLPALVPLLRPGSVPAETAGLSAGLPPSAARRVDFVKDIQPILAARCYDCHGPEKQKADLRWDNKASVFKTGEHGPLVIPGNSAGSRVIKLVAG